MLHFTPILGRSVRYVGLDENEMSHLALAIDHLTEIEVPMFMGSKPVQLSLSFRVRVYRGEDVEWADDGPPDYAQWAQGEPTGGIDENFMDIARVTSNLEIWLQTFTHEIYVGGL